MSNLLIVFAVVWHILVALLLSAAVYYLKNIAYNLYNFLDWLEKTQRQVSGD